MVVIPRLSEMAGPIVGAGERGCVSVHGRGFCGADARDLRDHAGRQLLFELDMQGKVALAAHVSEHLGAKTGEDDIKIRQKLREPGA